jgi:hypothetical protein
MEGGFADLREPASVGSPRRHPCLATIDLDRPTRIASRALEAATTDHPIEEKALSRSILRVAEREPSGYHFVRDEILYQMCPFSDAASDTLASKRGHCYQKANLEIALLRSLAIPAGFITQRIDPGVLRPFLSDQAMALLGERMAHAYACAFLDGRWVGADATFDKPLLDFALGDHWQMQESWDGARDVTLPAHLLIGRPSEPRAALYGPADLPDPTPREILLVLNRRLLAIRAEMEDRRPAGSGGGRG